MNLFNSNFWNSLVGYWNGLQKLRKNNNFFDAKFKQCNNLSYSFLI